ncbi:unnamed protein product, partial [Meganyctiphanes norvegica]
KQFSFSMASLTRSVEYELPVLSLEAPRVVTKGVQASSNPIAIVNPEVPRLVNYESKSGTCAACNKATNQSCADRCGMVFYCNADGQTSRFIFKLISYKKDPKLSVKIGDTVSVF